MKEIIESTAKDRHLKSILKGITWRIIATFTTIFIAYFITGKVIFALEIGGIEFISKIIIYYIHERLWINLPIFKTTFVQKRYNY